MAVEKTFVLFFGALGNVRSSEAFEFLLGFHSSIPGMNWYWLFFDFHLYRVTQLKTRTSVSVLSFVDICCFHHHVFIGQNLSFPHPVGTWMHMVFKPFISCVFLCLKNWQQLLQDLAALQVFGVWSRRSFGVTRRRFSCPKMAGAQHGHSNFFLVTPWGLGYLILRPSRWQCSWWHRGCSPVDQASHSQQYL